MLEQVIAATEEKRHAKIVQQEHSSHNINWAAGLSDPGEMIACGFLPEARRHEGETDTVYQARLLVELANRPELIERIKRAAQQRASLDTTGGRVRVMSAGVVPWHALGTVVDQAVDSCQAMKFSGTDIPIEKLPLFYEYKGQMLTSSEVFAIVRTDTGKQLGTVGSRYKVIPNRDAFRFVDGVLAEHGAKYETAGSLYDGAKLFLTAHLPKHSFTLPGDDRQECYVAFTNAHDSSETACCFPTSVRMVCANTYRTAGKDKQKGIRIRHVGDVDRKIRDAQKAIGIAVNSFDTYREQAETLVHKPLEMTHFLDDVLDATLEVTKADALAGADKLLEAVLCKTQAERDLARKSIERKLERRRDIYQDVMTRYETERNGKGGMRGTAWAALNAITEHADHNDLGKHSRDKVLRETRRFESVLSGPADELKQTAMRMALAN